MSIRRNPRMVWLAIACLIWAYVAAPVSAVVIPPGSVPGSDAPVGSSVSSDQTSDQSPVGTTMTHSPGDGSAVPSNDDTPQIQITGDKNLQLYLQQLLADQQSGHVDVSGFRSSSTTPDMTGLNINGTIQKNLSVSATMTPQSATTPDTRWTLRYNGDKTKVQFGDIPATLSGNELVTLNRTVQGLQINSSVKKGSVTGVVSKLQSQLQTESFNGQNTSGPYYLRMSPIVPGSDTISLNGSTLVRDQDYAIDTTSGIVNFTRGQLISTVDTVKASYEVMVNGTGGGNLVAIRGAYPVAKHLTVGVSHIGLTGNKTGSAQPTRLDRRDQFQGNNSTGPFYLMYRPVISGSETVTVNGLQQQNSIGYKLDYDSGQLTFTAGRQPALGATVVVNYQTSTTQQSGTDRSVTGVDVNWQATKGLTFNLQTAKSGGAPQQTLVASAQDIADEELPLQQNIPLNQQGLHLSKAPVLEGSENVRAVSLTLVRNQDYTINYSTGEIRLMKTNYPSVSLIPALMVTYRTAPVTAKKNGNSAMVATMSYNNQKLAATARYRKADQGFTSMDTTTSTLAEHATEWSANYSPSSTITLRTSGSNALMPSSTTSASASSTNEKNRSYAVDFHHPSGASVVLQHNTRNSQDTADTSNKNDYTSDNVTTSWMGNKLSTTVTLDRTVSGYQQPNIVGLPLSSHPITSLTTTKSTVYSATGNVGYHASDKLDMEVNVGANKINSDTDTGSSVSGGNSVQAMATYRPKQSITLTANAQTSSNKMAGAGEFGPTTQKNRNVALTAQWQAGKRLNLTSNFNADATNDTSFGTTATKSLSANLGYQASKLVTVNGYAARQHLNSTDSGATTRATLIGTGVKVGPIHNTTINVDLQRINGQSTDSVNQLWQTDAQTYRAPTMTTSTIGMPEVMGTALHALTGGVNYQLGDKHTIGLTGELVGGMGELGSSRRNAYGLNWQYHPDDNLTLSLNAQKVRYVDSAMSEMNYRATELSGELSASF